MQTYKRSQFSMIKGIICAPFGGLLVFILAQLLLPVPVCAAAGIIVAGAIGYITIISENIYFELDDDGVFRYFQKGKLRNTFDLAKCRIGYRRKTEWGILGNNDISLKILDDTNEEAEIEAGPLGTSQFNTMFEEMEQFSIQDTEVLRAKKE